MTPDQEINESVQFVKDAVLEGTKIGLVLGSGLGILTEHAQDSVRMPYADIPHFPRSTVEGHTGELVFGKLSNQSVVMMNGRFHMYEGYSAQKIAYPIRFMKALGIEVLILTNAAGGINHTYSAGDFMLIRDHLNLTGQNPLIGPNDPFFGTRFPDMTNAYSERLRNIALYTARQEGIELRQGVYAGLLGPNYETPAEIKMLRTLGGDAVGMSTVVETVAASHAGMEVLGISCISNMAAGILDHPLSHQEVVETTQKVKQTFAKLILKTIHNIAEPPDA